MGRTQRKTNKYLERYRRTLRRKVRTVVEFAPPNCSQAEFLRLFTEVYPDEVRSMEKHYEFYAEKNRHRRVGKPLHFPIPGELLFGMARSKLRQIDGSSWNADRANVAQQVAVDQSLHEQEKRREKYRENNISTQDVTPNYIIALTKKYWKEGRAEMRLHIVQECGKYKNDRTISFFRRVMAKEKDWFIKNVVFRTLQRFDEVVYLPPKGKGKRQKYNTLVDRFGCDYKEDVGRGPREIMEEFYTGQYIQELRDFDVFVSHAVSNREAVDQIVGVLNSIGLVAFVDWKSDRVDLSRSKSNEYTADVIQLRMRQSKCLILVRTRASDASVWAAWEVGYFPALGRPVVVYAADENLEPGPEFTRSYPQLDFSDSALRIEDNTGGQEFLSWFRRKCIDVDDEV